MIEIKQYDKDGKYHGYCEIKTYNNFHETLVKGYYSHGRAVGYFMVYSMKTGKLLHHGDGEGNRLVGYWERFRPEGSDLWMKYYFIQ